MNHRQYMRRVLSTDTGLVTGGRIIAGDPRVIFGKLCAKQRASIQALLLSVICRPNNRGSSTGKVRKAVVGRSGCRPLAVIAAR